MPRYHSLLVINFHPHFYISPYTDWYKVYQSILDRIYQDNAWVATCKEITEWWFEKYNANFGD